MLQSITTNPIFIRLTQNSKWPSLRATIWLTAMLAVISVALSSIGLLSLPSMEEQAIRIYREWYTCHQEPDRNTYQDPCLDEVVSAYGEMCSIYPTSLWVFLSLILLLLSPPVVGAVTAMQIGHSVQLGAHDLPPPRKMRDCIYAGLYRARLLPALTVGLAPGLTGGFLYSRLRLLIPDCTLTGRMSPLGYNGPHHITSLDIIEPMVIITATMTGLLILTLLAAALGAALSLWWHKARTAAIVTTSTITLAGALSGVAVLLWTVLSPITATPPSSMGIQEMWAIARWCPVPLVLLVPWIIRLARRWA